MKAGFAVHLRDGETEHPNAMTPLIDVVFQLLVFFMLTSTFARPALELELPDLEAHGDPAGPAAWSISLDAEGTVQVEGEVIQSPSPDKLAGLFQSAPERTSVALKADAEAPHGHVLTLLNAIGEAGIAQIYFVYEPLATAAAPGNETAARL